MFVQFFPYLSKHINKTKNKTKKLEKWRFLNFLRIEFELRAIMRHETWMANVNKDQPK